METNNPLFEKDIKEALKVLVNGGIIVYPTDTIWGLGCDATSEKAVGKLFKAKNRPEGKSMIVLLADKKELLQYIATPPEKLLSLQDAYEGPLTIIYPGSKGLAPQLSDEEGNIAIRIVKDEFCKELILRLQKPLVSTSANISGEAFPRMFKEINQAIINAADYTVQYRRNDDSIRKPSSIIKLEKNGDIKVVRP